MGSKSISALLALTVVMTVACAGTMTNFTTATGDLGKLTVYAVPPEGSWPLTTLFQVNLEVPREKAAAYDDCFYIHFEFQDGAESRVKTGCTTPPPQTAEGTKEYEVVESHTFENAGRYRVYVYVTPGPDKSNKLLAAAIVIRVREAKKLGDVYGEP